MAPADGDLTHDLTNSKGDDEALRANLLEKYDPIYAARSKDLLANADQLPDEIPEDAIGDWTDLTKSLTAQLRAMDNSREVEKAPHLRANQVIENTFQKMMQPLKDRLTVIKEKVKVASEKKKERLKKAAEEEARRKREEAERVRQQKEAEERERLRIAADAEAERKRIQREAEEAERKRIAAINEEKHWDMIELARLAAEAEDAEREAAKIRERIDAATRRATKERLKREADEREAQASNLKKSQTETAKEVEQTHQKLDHLNRRASWDEGLLVDAAAQEEERLKREAGRATRETEKAVNKEQTAIAVEQKVENAKSSEFSRTRGDLGSLASLSDRWTFAVTDWAAVDPVQIWPHITEEAKLKAFGSMVRAGHREIAGVHVYEEERLNVR